MAIYKRLQTLARAELGARRAETRPEKVAAQHIRGLQQSVRELRQHDAQLYQKLEALRAEQATLEARAIAAVQQGDDASARGHLDTKFRLAALEAQIARAREQLAEQLAASAKTIDVWSERLAETSTLPPSETASAQMTEIERALGEEASAASSYPQLSHGETRAKPQPLPTIAPAYPQGPRYPLNPSALLKVPSVTRTPPGPLVHGRDHLDEGWEERSPPIDALDGVTETFERFDAMEQKITELEARAELAGWSTVNELPAEDSEERMTDWSNEPTQPLRRSADESSSEDATIRLSEFDDPLHDPLMDAFNALDAAEHAQQLDGALAALKQRQVGQASAVGASAVDDPLAALRKRMKGD